MKREEIFARAVTCIVTVCTLCEYLVTTEYLEGLDEGPQQDADGVALPQELDEPSGSEQPQEAQVQQPVLLDTDGTSSTYQPHKRTDLSHSKTK